MLNLPAVPLTLILFGLSFFGTLKNEISSVPDIIKYYWFPYIPISMSLTCEYDGL